jgi:hypothetical protein
MQVADGVKGFVALFDQTLAAREKGMAGFGQRYAAGGAIEQAGLQAFLKPSHLPTYRR